MVNVDPGFSSSLALLPQRFERVRQFSETLCETLSAEDCALQTMPDVSPLRWHLAHTTWFFETFLLKPLRDYQPFDPQFEYLFNSYYNSVGDQFPRPQRGTQSRPTLNEIAARELTFPRTTSDSRTRLASRTTASGIDADRYQACLCL